MAIRIKVDDHPSESVERENSMTVGGAVQRAYAGKAVGLRARAPHDSVTIDGIPTHYGQTLKPEHRDAKIRVKTDAYQQELAHMNERTE